MNHHANKLDYGDEPAANDSTFGGTLKEVHDHFNSDGSRAQIGYIYSQSLLFLADYGLTDRLAVNLSVPYVRAKYVGDMFYAHKPALLAFPNNAPFIDDGAYRGSLQDIGFGVRYNIAARPVTLTPFIGANLPSVLCVPCAGSSPC